MTDTYLFNIVELILCFKLYYLHFLFIVFVFVEF